MKLTVEVMGTEVVAERMRKAGPEAQKLISKAIHKYALEIANEAKRRVPTDTGRLKSAIRAEFPKDLEAKIGPTGADVHYGPYVEFGTRPHFPPVSALESWARRHKIPSAFLVARAIGMRGTKPKPFLFPAWESVRPEFKRAIGEIVREGKFFRRLW